MMWEKRSNELEFIDLGLSHYSLEEYEDCLIKLGRIGKWLVGEWPLLNPISEMKTAPKSILDVGCGGGYLAACAAKKFPQSKVVGIDLNPLAISFANKQWLSKYPQIHFELKHEAELNEPAKSYDVVMASLVCHHMDDKNLVQFIKKGKQVAIQKLIIRDLHRHPISYGLFKMISPIFFPNRLINHDGALSIRRGFTRVEWIHYLEAAGIDSSQYKIRWHFPFQWTIEIECSHD